MTWSLLLLDRGALIYELTGAIW